MSSTVTWFFFSSRRRHTRWPRDWSSDVCSSDLLTFEFTTLETSIKDFFDQMDRLGKEISKNQIDLLYASGVVAVGAMLACEIARRKLQNPECPPVPFLARSLPYRDYR